MSEFPSKTARFFGALLMAVGGLMALSCGLCSLTLIVTALSQMFATRDWGQLLQGLFEGGLVVALVGGIPTFCGVLIFRAGRRRWRGPKPRPSPLALKAFDDESQG